MKADRVWKEPYHAAILETDDGKLQDRLHAAKAAIDARLHELQQDRGGTPEERQAISDALSNLVVIRGEFEVRSHDMGLRNA